MVGSWHASCALPRIAVGRLLLLLFVYSRPRCHPAPRSRSPAPKPSPSTLPHPTPHATAALTCGGRGPSARCRPQSPGRGRSRGRPAWRRSKGVRVEEADSVANVQRRDVKLLLLLHGDMRGRGAEVRSKAWPHASTSRLACLPCSLPRCLAHILDLLKRIVCGQGSHLQDLLPASGTASSKFSTG